VLVQERERQLQILLLVLLQHKSEYGDTKRRRTKRRKINEDDE
jgi:hypothetical protein